MNQQSESVQTQFIDIMPLPSSFEQPSMFLDQVSKVTTSKKKHHTRQSLFEPMKEYMSSSIDRSLA